MLISYKLGQGSIVLRVKLLNSSVTTGAGLTGLTSASTGLIISTIANNEATATAYTVAGSNVETITTLGTYAAPASGKCRFKEVDATNHKGIYEIQIADARFNVSNAKTIIVSISGATNLVECDALIPLVQLDPYNATPKADIDTIKTSSTAATNLKNSCLSLVTGTVSADGSNSTTSFKVDATLGAKVANYFGNSDGGLVLAFIDGTTNEWLTRRVTAFNTTTDFITVEEAFPATPSDDDTFILLGRITELA